MTLSDVIGITLTKVMLTDVHGNTHDAEKVQQIRAPWNSALTPLANHGKVPAIVGTRTFRPGYMVLA